MHTQHQSIFARYSLSLNATSENKSLSLPLKDHVQIPFLIDILGRKDRHHLLLQGVSSEKMHLAMIDGIAHFLKNETPAKKLHEAEFIYFDMKRFSLGNESLEQIEKNFHVLYEEINTTGKYLIFVMNDVTAMQTKETQSTVGYMGQLLKSVLTHDKWRFIISTETEQPLTDALSNYFTSIPLREPTESETIAILKTHQSEIENFHHIIIPDEIFTYAYSLTKHYLGGKSHLNRSLELIDSSAARASTLEHSDNTSQSYRPLLTTNILAHVVSSWTHIPATHLHYNKFKIAKFVQSLQQKIFGQDTALNSIASILQSTCIKQQEKTGTVSNFLFAGPQGSGKRTCANAIADYLFGHTTAFLRVILNKHHQPTSLSDVFVLTNMENQNGRLSLLDAIQQTPYAVILFENLHEMPAHIIDLFSDIFLHGHAFDRQGNQYNFHHAITVVTTTLASEQIKSITQQQASQQSTNMMDLMQLVLNDNPNQASSRQVSNQDLLEQIIPILQTGFSAELVQHFQVIPFICLEQTALEKILKIKLTSLASSLTRNFGIELNFAPEVIKFLANELSKQQNNAQAVEKILELHVYTCVAHEVLMHIDEKTRPKRLYLLLNDSGQVLRCEFVAASVMA